MDQTSAPIHTAELPWMPLGDGVFVRPLRFAGKERSLQLKVNPGAKIGPHRHGGFVHAFNVSGSRRLGDGTIAGPGAYIYEPPGNEDSWACEGDEPVIVQITMSGRVSYVDGDGLVTSSTDTSSLRERYLAWCKAEGHKPVALGSE